MKASDRFLKYVKIDTMSNPKNAGIIQPSTPKQFDLARVLVEDMKNIGINNPHVDEKCYVYGWLDATQGFESIPPLGFIAHMDTSPAASGENVKALTHENYDGGVIRLPSGREIDPKIFPALNMLIGDTLISASGDTLLGADNKAGIAEILTLCDELIRENIPHGKICVAFTPDEEIGAGADGFDVEKFGAKYAYTVDGGPASFIEYETFNAASARVTLNGVSVHPGGAKDIMVNSIKLAMEFNSLLPVKECPEHTEGREGFYHLDEINGNVEKTVLEYIIRDHDRAVFESRKKQMSAAVDAMNERHGENTAILEMKDSYYNMGEIIRENFHLIENAKEAIRKAGLTPETNPIRGGTDGSRLSFMGLPCPNLGTGGFYFHGPNELASIQQMDKVVEILKNIVDIYSKA